MAIAPASAVGSLCRAILALLRADAGIVAALGTGGVFDVVPARETLPWIYLGPVGTKRLENGCFRGWEIRQRLFCASAGFNRDGAWAIAEAVDLVLDATAPSLAGTGFTLSGALRMAESGDLIDPTKPRTVFTDVVGLVYRDAPQRGGSDDF